MSGNKKAILVLWDFTKDSENSLFHAIQLAKVADNEIILMHIVKKRGFFSNSTTFEQKIEEANYKLTSKAEDVFEISGIKPKVVVKEGALLHLIAGIIPELNINLLIMGSVYHSNGNKISVRSILSTITKTKTPVIVPEALPTHSHYVEIVVPIESDKKYKETLRWIINLSKLYKCNINFIKPFLKDKYQKEDMRKNIYFTKKMLDKYDIVYGIKTAKKDQDYREEIFKFASKIDADLIVAMTKKYHKYVDQKKKPNSVASKTHIPIMYINPRADIRKYGGFR
ncbi:MAG: universal stress protein [Chlorobi bacterium]|nr:universal stress protein [Chlorobiota bacterium]